MISFLCPLLILVRFVLQLRPDSHRRKWDRDEFEKLAQERVREEEEAEAGPSTSKGAAKRRNSEDDSNNYDNLVWFHKILNFIL